MPSSEGQLAFASELGSLVRDRRLKAGLSEAEVRDFLELSSIERLRAFEDGLLELPLEEICGLANLLNIAPEDVLVFVRIAID